MSSGNEGLPRLKSWEPEAAGESHEPQGQSCLAMQQPKGRALRARHVASLCPTAAWEGGAAVAAFRGLPALGSQGDAHLEHGLRIPVPWGTGLPRENGSLPRLEASRVRTRTGRVPGTKGQPEGRLGVEGEDQGSQQPSPLQSLPNQDCHRTQGH